MPSLKTLSVGSAVSLAAMSVAGTAFAAGADQGGLIHLATKQTIGSSRR
ncbi:hypothetical protein [Lichenifustis flavocetrariae]|uniref:Uncharacterized protein n=1 Tax=Lichenifustis flavocetrariae TaxID=2949735 RepID=A0AA41YWB7_9HYPH|nr:hypothetical protein [Lichenifustis flavocetrariae]MCW6508347.1 hypothetical protein [Lichenifustis flavocetrariae]